MGATTMTFYFFKYTYYTIKELKWNKLSNKKNACKADQRSFMPFITREVYLSEENRAEMKTYLVVISDRTPNGLLHV